MAQSPHTVGPKPVNTSTFPPPPLPPVVAPRAKSTPPPEAAGTSAGTTQTGKRKSLYAPKATTSTPQAAGPPSPSSPRAAEGVHGMQVTSASPSADVAAPAAAPVMPPDLDAPVPDNLQKSNHKRGTNNSSARSKSQPEPTTSDDNADDAAPPGVPVIGGKAELERSNKKRKIQQLSTEPAPPIPIKAAAVSAAAPAAMPVRDADADADATKGAPPDTATGAAEAPIVAAGDAEMADCEEAPGDAALPQVPESGAASLPDSAAVAAPAKPGPGSQPPAAAVQPEEEMAAVAVANKKVQPVAAASKNPAKPAVTPGKKPVKPTEPSAEAIKEPASKVADSADDGDAAGKMQATDEPAVGVPAAPSSEAAPPVVVVPGASAAPAAAPNAAALKSAAPKAAAVAAAAPPKAADDTVMHDADDGAPVDAPASAVQARSARGSVAANASAPAVKKDAQTPPLRASKPYNRGVKAGAQDKGAGTISAGAAQNPAVSRRQDSDTGATPPAAPKAVKAAKASSGSAAGAAGASAPAAAVAHAAEAVDVNKPSFQEVINTADRFSKHRSGSTRPLLHVRPGHAAYQPPQHRLVADVDEDLVRHIVTRIAPRPKISEIERTEFQYRTGVLEPGCARVCCGF